MKRAIVALALSSLTLAASSAVSAAPKHPICADLGPTFGTGVSHFSAAGDWAEKAASQFGVKWKYLYWYLTAVNDPPEAQASWIKGNVQIARSVGAIPVFTFYQLLGVGQNHGVSGSEPQIVQKVLKDPSLMREYFDRFIFVLETLASEDAPILLQVEPDTWGFMIWAMGVEGNSDATSVPVKVKSSGHADVSGFSDHAGGLGRALLKLRDQFAPKIRLGFHASNFRAGNSADVVASFYGSMGEWDVLFSEFPHLEANEKQWWLPWEEARVTKNLAFFSTLSSAAHLPILIWQSPIGTADFHLFSSGAAMRARFADAGVVGVMFSMRGKGNPDDFRADEEPDLATVPPPSSGAGGTAKDMRTRLAAYSKAPLAWPTGSVCASSP